MEQIIFSDSFLFDRIINIKKTYFMDFSDLFEDFFL